MYEKKVLSTIDEIKAYNDPYRLKIFLNFLKIERPATSKEIADVMGEAPSKIHYHVKKMENAGILVLVYTKIINGINAKYYEPVAKTISVENPYLEDNSRKLMTSEISKSIGKIYNEAKEKFIAQYEKYESEPDNDKYRYICMLSEIHLMDEEAKELQNIINKAKNRTYNNDSNEKTYSFFMSYIKID